MTKLCYYISDHGWGHAARSIAIIRELLAQSKDIQIIVKANYPLQFMKDSLKGERVRFYRCKKDFGFVLKDDTLSVNKNKTKQLLIEWITTWDDFIKQEKSFCKQNDISLIISDIAPQPFIVADALNIPGIAISNFTWYGIYSHLFGETKEVKAIKDAYQLANLALILPMAENNLPFPEIKNISLVVRKPTIGRKKIRQRLGISSPDKLIYLGLGAGISSIPVLESLLKAFRGVKPFLNSNINLLLSSHLNNAKIFGNANIPIIRIPLDDTESQNYIAASDLVITKAGYSTISEAIAACVPMLVAAREGISEDESIIKAIESLGVARKIDSFRDTEIILNSLLAHMDGSFRKAYNQLPKRYSLDGNKEAAKTILNSLLNSVTG